MESDSRKSNTVLILIATIGVFGTILAATIAAIGNYNVEKLRLEAVLTQTALFPTSTSTPKPSAITPIPQNVQAQVSMLQTQVAILENNDSSQTTSQSYASGMATVESNQESLNRRLAVIEQAILDNPEKSLELTLMRKEIENIKEANRLDTEQTNKLIERLYSQNNWFIGLIFTIALSLVGLAVSNFVKKPEPTAKKKRENAQTEKQ